MIVSEAKARDAYAVLRPEEPFEEMDRPKVQWAFKQAAKVAHPDAGGSAEQFAEVDRAKHVLLAWVEKPMVSVPIHKKQACGYCNGKGHVFSGSSRPGSAGLRRTCPQCHGSGDADYDAR